MSDIKLFDVKNGAASELPGTAATLEKLSSPAIAPIARFRRYPNYKDSGVEWLGDIPEHWETKRVRYAAPISDERSCDGITDLPYIALEHIEQGTGRLVRDLPAESTEGATSRFRTGDVLFGKLRPYLAKVLQPDFEGTCSTELLVLRPTGEIEPKLLAYQLLSQGFISWIDSLTYGTKMPRANPSQVADTEIAIPRTAAEQRAIATFLDRETARIDALVAKKERLIELLQEKRTALITRAVSKGLDSKVPMKDSGVEWLGEIPAHWEVRKLSWVTQCLDGRRIPLNAEERSWMQGEYPYWGANSIVDHVDRWLFDEDLVLLGEDGAPFFDRHKPVAFHVQGRIWVNNHAHVLRPSHGVDPGFLASALNCVDYREFIAGTTRDKLTQGDMNRIVVPIPPAEEQRRIQGMVAREGGKCGRLVERVQAGIRALVEFRSALISAAVTGKIDVREEAA